MRKSKVSVLFRLEFQSILRITDTFSATIYIPSPTCTEGEEDDPCDAGLLKIFRCTLSEPLGEPYKFDGPSSVGFVNNGSPETFPL